MQDRNFNVKLYSQVWIDESNKRVTFPLWNLSGQLIGYQQYAPNKKRVSGGKNKEEQKYFTYVTKIDRRVELAVWGLETLNPKLRTIYLVEGIFKACRLHNYGLNSLALLGNNPLHLKTWLHTLGYKLIALCDGDIAGQELTKFGDESLSLCKNQYLDDFTEYDLYLLLNQLGETYDRSSGNA